MLLIAFILCLVVRGTVSQDDANFEVADDAKIEVTFVNELPQESIELFWEDHEAGTRKPAGTIGPRGKSVRINSFKNHEFSYVIEGERHYITPPTEPGHDFITLLGSVKEIRVRCEMSDVGEEETLDLIIMPYWSPRGASRFLELVREGYYDGVALSRVVPNFLTQFGISKNVELREKYKDARIGDDVQQPDLHFKPGFLSYAGSGVNSRTTEVFVVMPGTPQHQLDYFSTNSWETPFGYVDGDVETSVLSRIFAYGDMPPWGEGPSSTRIYEKDGYDYLKEESPSLNYIDECYITDEVGSDIAEYEVESDSAEEL